MARPTSFRPEIISTVLGYAQAGLTDLEISDLIGVSLATFKNWKTAHPQFLAALKIGKEAADNRVERSLYAKATGYTFDTEKVFQFQGQIVRAQTREHVPPDTTAMIFWLKNRRPDLWRDKTLFEHSGSLQDLSDGQLDALLRRYMANEKPVETSH